MIVSQISFNVSDSVPDNLNSKLRNKVAIDFDFTSHCPVTMTIDFQNISKEQLVWVQRISISSFLQIFSHVIYYLDLLNTNRACLIWCNHIVDFLRKVFSPLILSCLPFPLHHSSVHPSFRPAFSSGVNLQPYGATDRCSGCSWLSQGAISRFLRYEMPLLACWGSRINIPWYATSRFKAHPSPFLCMLSLVKHSFLIFVYNSMNF